MSGAKFSQIQSLSVKVRHAHHIGLVLTFFIAFQKKLNTLDNGIPTQDIATNDSRTAAIRQRYDCRHFISVIITQAV
jgi:hypothetical protein